MVQNNIEDDVKIMLQSMMEYGRISYYKVEGNDVYVTLVRPVERINIKIEIER